MPPFPLVLARHQTKEIGTCPMLFIGRGEVGLPKIPLKGGSKVAWIIVEGTGVGSVNFECWPCTTVYIHRRQLGFNGERRIYIAYIRFTGGGDRAEPLRKTSLDQYIPPPTPPPSPSPPSSRPPSIVSPPRDPAPPASPTAPPPTASFGPRKSRSAVRGWRPSARCAYPPWLGRP